jgi:hypothetical protein
VKNKEKKELRLILRPTPIPVTAKWHKHAKVERRKECFLKTKERTKITLLSRNDAWCSVRNLIDFFQKKKKLDFCESLDR